MIRGVDTFQGAVALNCSTTERFKDKKENSRVHTHSCKLLKFHSWFANFKFRVGVDDSWFSNLKLTPSYETTTKS